MRIIIFPLLKKKFILHSTVSRCFVDRSSNDEKENAQGSYNFYVVFFCVIRKFILRKRKN